MARIGDLLKRDRTVSFEFFPPKTDSQQLSLGRTIAELESLNPSFVSVTYGAGGSTRQRTREVVSWVRRETPITPMAHLTCLAHSRHDIAGLLDQYREAAIENILALGGDPPIDGGELVGDYEHATDLIDDIVPLGHFSVGVAAHPEVHPRSPDRETDRKHLAAKLARADFAITQFFFDVEHWVRLVDELADLGVTKPVIPGIMPVTNLKQVSRFAEMNGTGVPSWLVEKLEGVDDPDEVRRIGVDAATELCAELLERGAPGLHFYTLNRSTATREIHGNLQLTTS